MGRKYWLLLLLIAVVGLIVHIRYWQIPANALEDQDIYFIWLEGKRILLGENPYARVLAGNLRDNDKYATYFPLAYYLSAIIQTLGLTEFREWLYLWRPVSFGFHIGIVAITLQYFQQKGAWLFGIVAASTVLLSRWSLYIIQVHHLEFAAIFCLLLSLSLLQKRTRFSLLLYGLSLGIKQIAIFLLPLYLIYLAKQETKDNRLKGTIFGLLLILSIPLIASIPFLIWNPEGFVKSILFSATRFGTSHIENASSLDVYFSQFYPWLIGFKAKLLMLLLMGMTYLSFWKERTSILMSSSMTMMIFLYFNSVLFLQYFIWPLCLVLITFSELLEPSKPVK